ncbi:hypothetical protein ACU4GD_00155 [Cupriavidus basilensis]
MMGMALTGKVVPYKVGFGPFPADVFHAPYPNALHGVRRAGVDQRAAAAVRRRISIRGASPPSSSNRSRRRAVSM